MSNKINKRESLGKCKKCNSNYFRTTINFKKICKCNEPELYEIIEYMRLRNDR